MPDPLSITTGVLALLQVTIKVGNELKKLHDGATVVYKTISELENDVSGLTSVLESMRSTFESNIAEHGTGHIANLWDNVAKAIEDVKGILGQLAALIQEISKESKVLDEHRKQLRLNRAEDKIRSYRVHIQSYRDGLHLSLQAILLWNQMSYQRTADQVLPNLSDLHNDVRRIATDLNQRIDLLQSMMRSQQDLAQVATMSNLRDCVRAAASTISSPTTIITSHQEEEGESTIPTSDFGDCFPLLQNLTMRRWMDSHNVYEYEETVVQAPRPESVADVPALVETDSGVDSDAELENEMMRLLVDRGKQKLAAGDTQGAEKMLRNCLSRYTSTGRTANREQNLIRLEAMQHLYDIFFDQRRWESAQDMLLQKMAIRARLTGQQDAEYTADVLKLAKVMMEQNDITAAQLHARRALRDFKKLHQVDEIKACLNLLINLCKIDGDENDAELYAIMLDDLNDNGSKSDVPAGTNDTLPNERNADLLKSFEKQNEKFRRRVRYTAGSMIRRKLVIVGDAAVGKTALLFLLTNGIFLDNPDPIVFHNFAAGVEVDGAYIKLALFDTPGMEDFDKLRPLSYRDSHVILICFAIDNPDSLANMHSKWISGILHFCPGVPFILVGMKKDLRIDPRRVSELNKVGKHPVTTSEGEEAREKIGALAYMECSAKTNEGVKEIFKVAGRAAWHAGEMQREEERNKQKEERNKKIRSLFLLSKPS